MQNRGSDEAAEGGREGAATKAIALLHTGEIERAVEAARKAVVIADRVKNARARSASRLALALSLVRAGSAEEARPLAEDAARIAHASTDYAGEALAWSALAETERAMARDVASLEHAARARAIVPRAKDPAATCAALTELALSLSRVGDGERSREIFDDALAIAPTSLPPERLVRLLHAVAMAHHTAGRTEHALVALDRAERIAKKQAFLGMLWPLTVTRFFALLDAGAVDEARSVLDASELASDAPSCDRAEHTLLLAHAELASGAAPDGVVKLSEAALSAGRLEKPTRIALEHVRASALLARGRRDEAERLAIALIGESAQGGARRLVGLAMALAARAASNPQSAMQRWLGAHGLASGGVSARIEHESLAALSCEPEPIGMLGRTGLAVVRERLIDRSPPYLRATTKRTLRQVELGFVENAQAQRAVAEIALDAATLSAKERVGLVGTSPPLLRAIATVARASKNASSLVLVGETGSGKELFARLAHELSPRARGPFVAINCAAIPEQLLEAELFGHEKGAFTGADRTRKGLFVEAEGGTLFLDELGEMSAGMQAKLLRVLEDREVRAVGGNKSRKVDVRVIGATHRDLVQLIAGRQFREDLYYRIAALTVRVPPLRERPEDVPTIARAILQRDPSTRGFRIDVPGLSALAEYGWPGNVRELANVVQLAVAVSENDVVGGVEVRKAIGERAQQNARARGPSAQEALPRSDGAPKASTLAELRDRQRLELADMVRRALAGADGNKRAAARALGISRQGLYRVLGEVDS